jgi:hypothetical protein
LATMIGSRGTHCWEGLIIFSLCSPILILMLKGSFEQWIKH